MKTGLRLTHAMVYIKSILFGLALAIVTMVAWLFGEMAFLLPQLWSMSQSGSGGIGAVSTVSYGPFVGLAAFALGFYFMLRRLKSRGRNGVPGSAVSRD
jgi:hypothetical protein